MSDALSAFAQTLVPAAMLLTVYYLGRHGRGRPVPSRHNSWGRARR